MTPSSTRPMEVIDEEFDRLVDELWDLLDMLVLRDFQSRNLMRKDGEWKIIDFQDALIGPFSYDLVALLARLVYRARRRARMRELVDYYTTRARRGLPWCGDPDAVWRAFNLQTVQRKLKDAGRFVYIDRVKDNPDFLEYYDASIGYVESALEQLPGWGDLAHGTSRRRAGHDATRTIDPRGGFRRPHPRPALP